MRFVEFQNTDKELESQQQQKNSKNMSNFLDKNNNNSALQPIIPLAIKNNKEDKVVEKLKRIMQELKTGSRKKLPATYKKSINCFKEGTEFELIQLIYNIKEVFK